MFSFSLISTPGVIICAIVMMACLFVSGLLAGMGRIGPAVLVLAGAALGFAVGLDVSSRLPLLAVPALIYTIGYIVFAVLAVLGLLFTLGGGRLPGRKAKTS